MASRIPTYAPPRQLSHTQPELPHAKPLPSVPQDVDDDASELVYNRPSLNLSDENQIESDISSASASTASPSMEQSDWHETSLRNQVTKLQIQYTDLDLSQTEAPSVFGLRRRIVAAAIDVVDQQRTERQPTTNTKDDRGEGSSSGKTRQFDERGLAEWLATQPSSGSQSKIKSLRKKISFGKKLNKSAYSSQASLHDPMPSPYNANAAPSIISSTSSYTNATSRSRASSTAGSTNSHEKMLKRDKDLAERESNFDLVVLSRFETAELNMTIYTESRQGNWVVKGPAPAGTKVLEEPPLVFSPWDCAIDSIAIVERKKLRSFIELSDTTCAVRCSTCTSRAHQEYRKGGGGFMDCKHCRGRGAVMTTYVVCITLRQSTFLPLTMPAKHRSGKHQDAFRTYLPRTTTAALSHVDLLRMRSLESVRSCALRVGRAHGKEYDARLLLARATLERRGCSSVAVINRHSGLFRVFDITDGGFVRGMPTAGMVEEESRISEKDELREALMGVEVTKVVSPEGTWRFVGLELVDMASSKEVRMINVERCADGRFAAPGAGVGEGGGGGSVYSGTSTDDSYSPSAFSFFQRAQQQQHRTAPHHHPSSSQDSQMTRDTLNPQPSRTPIPHSNDESQYQLPPLNLDVGPTSNASLTSSHSSFTSFQSAQERTLTLTLPTPPGSKPWLTSKDKNGLPSPALSSTSNSSALSFGRASSATSFETSTSGSASAARSSSGTAVGSSAGRF